MTAATIDVECLTLDDAEALCGKLKRHIARSTPLSEDATKVYRVMSEAMGGLYPVEEVAESLGIDLATATEEDGWRLSAFYGARLGEGPPA